MALRDGFPSASGLADALDLRLGLAGLVVRDTAGNPRTGIFPRHANHLVSATATMNSAVSTFEAVNSRSGQGVILLANDGVTNVLHPNAPVANSRYDIVYEKQNDSVSPNADANSLPVFGVLSLAASPSPTLPTYATAKAALDAAPGVLPGAEPLEAVLIPSTATTTSSAGVVYTALHQFTAATGGVVWFRTNAELDLWTTAVPDQHAYVIADNSEYVWLGSGWVLEGVKLSHIEFTSTVSIANSTDGTMGALTLDPDASTDTGLVTSPALGQLRLQPGIYTITLKAEVAGGASPTGLTLLGLKNAAGLIVFRTAFPVGNAYLLASYPNLVVTAQQDLTTYLYQTTGGTRTITGRVIITKLSEF